MLIENDSIDGGSTEDMPDCPTSFVSEGSACSAEGQVCAFDEPEFPDRFNRSLCGCWEASTTELRWHCFESISSSWQCPSEQPKNGADCFGHYGTECMYPERTLCTCAEETGVFSCVDAGRDNIGKPPPSVPDEQPIPALTDEQRADWCDWFVAARIGPGFPEPSPVPPDPDGYSTASGCELGWEFACQALIPTISSSDCEANLSLSTCAAPIVELTDCVITLYDSCWPSPHGCARYLERPGCSGTIAVRNDIVSPRDELRTACQVRIQ
jgi:hypothetical protein